MGEPDKHKIVVEDTREVRINNESGFSALMIKVSGEDNRLIFTDGLRGGVSLERVRQALDHIEEWLNA